MQTGAGAGARLSGLRGGPKTANFGQVVHVHPDAVGHITIGGNNGAM